MGTLIAMALAALAWLVVFTMGHAGDAGADELVLHAARLAATGLTALTVAQLLQRLLSYGLLGRKSSSGKASSDLARSVMNATIYLVVGVLFLRYGLGQDVTSVLATSALVTVILGMALQPTLGHLFSGVSIEIERPLRVGDFVRRDELEGQVVSLSWRSVSLLTDRGTTLVMPNAEFTSRSVEIIRASQPSRHQAVFHMASDCSPSRVINIALQVLRSDLPGVVRTPAPSVFILGADPMTGTLRFAARFFTLNFLGRSLIASLFMERLWFALSREGLALPSRSALDWPGDEAGTRALSRPEAERGAPGADATTGVDGGPRAWPRRLGQTLQASAHAESLHAFVPGALAALPVELRARLLEHGRLLRYGPDERCARGVAGVVIQGRLVEDRKPEPGQYARDLAALRERVAGNPVAGADTPLMAPESFDRFLGLGALAIGPLAHTLCLRIAACTDDVTLAHEVLAESIADGGRREAFLAQADMRPTTQLAAGAWFGWPAALGLEDDEPACRAAGECAVFVWDAAALRGVLLHAAANEHQSLAEFLQARAAGAADVSAGRLLAWAGATT